MPHWPLALRLILTAVVFGATAWAFAVGQLGLAVVGVVAWRAGAGKRMATWLIAAVTTVQALLMAAVYHASLDHLPLMQAIVARSWFQPQEAEYSSLGAHQVRCLRPEAMRPGNTEAWQ